jgi:hypothetical protein
MMLPGAFVPWIPFVVALLALLLVQQTLIQVIFAFFYRLTHNRALAMLLYALLVWPGTALHELAHWSMARLLGVYAATPHLLPSPPDKQGRMVLGHVMVERSDVVRRSLIGVAPLVAGSVAVALLGHYAFTLPVPALEEQGFYSLRPLVRALPTVFAAQDAWVYLYLLFAIANAMMPSPSDREAWPTLLLFVALVGLALAFTIGLPQVPPDLTAVGLRLAGWLTFAFILTAVLDTALLFILWPLERLLWHVGR